MESKTARKLAQAVILAGQKEGITFRTFGGAGVMLLRPAASSADPCHRDPDDVDLVGRFHEQPRWADIMAALKFEVDAKSTGPRESQYEFHGTFDNTECHIHIYSAPLRFSENVPGPYFTDEWPWTIPPTALLLSKLMIQRPNDQEDQTRDVAALLSMHPVNSGGSKQEDVAYLRSALFKGFAGWRRLKAVERSIERVSAFVCGNQSCPTLSKAHSGLIHLESILNGARPNLGWKAARFLHGIGLRAMVGPVDTVEPMYE